MESFPASDDRFSDKLWLLPPRVLGFALDTRRWAQFSVKSLVPVRTEKADMVFDDELVFPTELDGEDKKGLLKALVCNHDKRPKGPDLMTDGIEGKGLGLVILLHGAILGKTLRPKKLNLGRTPWRRQDYDGRSSSKGFREAFVQSRCQRPGP